MTALLFVVRAFEGYLLLGLAFAPFFAWKGSVKVDPGAAGGTTGFRLVILPGVALLWPVCLRLWWRAMHPEGER